MLNINHALVYSISNIGLIILSVIGMVFTGITYRHNVLLREDCKRNRLNEELSELDRQLHELGSNNITSGITSGITSDIKLYNTRAVLYAIDYAASNSRFPSQAFQRQIVYKLKFFISEYPWFLELYNMNTNNNMNINNINNQLSEQDWIVKTWIKPCPTVAKYFCRYSKEFLEPYINYPSDYEELERFISLCKKHKD